MMKWLTVAVVAVVLAAPVFAADGDADKPVRVRGVVKEVKADTGKTDAGTLSVTVKGKEAEEAMVFVINSETVIKGTDVDLKLTELKVGDKVRVDYKEAGGKKVASRIRTENEE
jgi:opacity protein-like surface antigen